MLTIVSSRWLRAEGPASSAGPPVTGQAKLSPELTEGPFYIDLERIRRDITEGKPGVPLQLRFRVVNGATGAAIPNAAVDVWHCDAQGLYSGFEQHGPLPDMARKLAPELTGTVDDGPPPGGPMQHKPDNAQTFLRGVQLTDAHGMARMDTIFPGWYAGRTPHIHVRVHVGGTMGEKRYAGGHISHTGQLFFSPGIEDAVYAEPAYARKETGRMAQQDDGIFRQDGRLITPARAVNAARLAEGLVAEPVLVIDPAATPRAAGFDG